MPVRSGPLNHRPFGRVRLATALGLVVALACWVGGTSIVSAAPTDPPKATASADPGTVDPEESTTADPTPTVPTTTPSPTMSTTPPSATPTEPSPTPSATVSASATPSASPSPTPSATSSSPGATIAPPRPPAVADAGQDPTSWIIAAVVLLLSAVGVLLVLRRPHPIAAVPSDPATVLIGPGPGTKEATAARLASLEAVGSAMLDAGYSVTGVRSALEDIAAVNGYPDTEVVVLPTALLVSARGVGEVSTGAVSTGDRSLMMNQIDALDDVVKGARSRAADAAATTAAVLATRTLARPYSPVQRVVAHGLLSGGLAVLLGASWPGIPIAMVLGVAVGTVLLISEKVSRAQEALVTVATAFGVSAAVFGLTRAGLDAGILPALIAPLATLLPGGLLTTGVIELATGQMMSGAGRLAGGFMQLVLLAVGVLAGATLVGTPAITFGAAENPTGPLAPWFAVAVFGVAMVIYRCGRRASIPWVLLVLYVAYGAQVLGDVFFGGVLSALIGAFAMTPVAYLVSTQRSGPAAFTSFLPAFWMLVPGALGLVGVASLMGGDSAGLNTLGTTAGTMVSITLGILAGSVIGAKFAGRGITVAV